MPRPTCTFCARKHLSQAYVLCEEALQGYPEHIWFALGHMAEASAELLGKHPEAADAVREARKTLELSINENQDPSKWVIPPFHQLIKDIGALGGIFAPAPTFTPTFPPTFPPTSTPPPEAPAPVKAPATPCPSCLDKARKGRWAAEAGQIGEGKEYPRGRLLILTTLADFTPSYSLVTVILDQATAAAAAGYRVTIGVHIGCNLSLLPPLSPAVDVVGIIPAFPWKEDTINERAVSIIRTAIENALVALGPCKIICHDLLFQSWFLTIAKAIHDIPADDRWTWYHMAHSSVSAPRLEILPDVVISYRRRLPVGHTLLILNYADKQHFANYYGLDESRIKVLLNSRDCRVFMGMNEEAATIVSKHTPHLVDVAQVYPVSLPRLRQKHAEKIIEVLGAIKKAGQSVCLIFATAHANSPSDQDKVAWARGIAQANGLTESEVVFTHESLPKTAARGLDRDAVRALFGVTNLFVFPTESEAGSLILLEAAQSGCLLVLNESLPCLADYVRREDALWVPWGSVKEQGRAIPLEPLAGLILNKLDGMGHRSKRVALAEGSLEKYSERLVAVLEG